MITKEDLLEAIAECQGERNPNANTCKNLAAFYIILDHMTSNEDEPIPIRGNSYKSGYSSDSEFMVLIKDKSLNDIMPVIDELMQTLQILNPGLYNGVIRKLI